MSRERLSKELGLESLCDRRWVRTLTFLYKIVEGDSPQYRSDYLKRNNNSVYNTGSVKQTEKFFHLAFLSGTN